MLRPAVVEAALDLDDYSVSRMDASAQRVVDRAISCARQWHHGLLTNEHIFLAFASVERRPFTKLMRQVGVSPTKVVREARAALESLPKAGGRELRVAPDTKLLFKLAFHHTARAGRRSIESYDLFSAIFEVSQSVPVAIMRRHGVEPELLISCVASKVRELEPRVDRRPRRALATQEIFDDARKRVEAEVADLGAAWPDPPRTFRQRLLDLMGFRAKTKT